VKGITTRQAQNLKLEDGQKSPLTMDTSIRSNWPPDPAPALTPVTERHGA